MNEEERCRAAILSMAEESMDMARKIKEASSRSAAEISSMARKLKGFADTLNSEALTLQTIEEGRKKPLAKVLWFRPRRWFGGK